MLDAKLSRDLFYKAVFESGLTIVSEGYYEFNPHGFTCFLLLAESHASLHAWPEHGYCAIDLFTCNLDLDIQPLINRLQVMFGAADISVRKIEREAEVRELCLL
jgi:S-adenosylmethionine decarboxylase